MKKILNKQWRYSTGAYIHEKRYNVEMTFA